MVGGAYLVKGLLHRLRVVEAIDQGLTHQPEIDATYGKLAQVVIANRLTFTPAPLSQLAPWAAEHGLDRVFGVDAAWLDDDRLGAMLEALADHQVDIWSRVLARAVDRFQVDLSELHSDTTSVYFEGADEDENGQPLGGGERVPVLVEGYNKDGQRHKVQLVLSLITAGRTPVWYRPWDGNQTDEAVYVADLSALRRTWLVPDNAVLIGERKLSPQETQVRFSQPPQLFLGAHPWTDRAKAVWGETQAQLAAGKQRWQTVDYASQNDVRQPAAERTVYRVCAVSRELADPETGELYPLRWGFSHSSTKAAQDARQRDKALAAGEQALRRSAGLLGQYDYTRRATIEVRLEQAPAIFSCTGGVCRAPSVTLKSSMGWRGGADHVQAASRGRASLRLHQEPSSNPADVAASTETLGRVDVADHVGHPGRRAAGIAGPALAGQTGPTLDGLAPRPAEHRPADGGSLAAGL